MAELQENALGFSPVTQQFIETTILFLWRSENAKGIYYVSRMLESLLAGRIYIVADYSIQDFSDAVKMGASMRIIANARIKLEEIERRLNAGGDVDQLLELAYHIFINAEKEVSGG
jgi:hypothetical protein